MEGKGDLPSGLSFLFEHRCDSHLIMKCVAHFTYTDMVESKSWIVKAKVSYLPLPNAGQAGREIEIMEKKRKHDKF